MLCAPSAQFRRQFHLRTQFFQAQAKRHLRTPLRNEQRTFVRYIRCAMPVLMHIMVAKDSRTVVGTQERMRLPINKNPINDPNVIENFQAPWLHAFSTRPGSILICFFDDPEVHTPASQVAGENKSGRTGSNDENRNITCMGDRSVHGEKFLNSASSLTPVNAGD